MGRQRVLRTITIDPVRNSHPGCQFESRQCLKLAPWDTGTGSKM